VRITGGEPLEPLRTYRAKSTRHSPHVGRYAGSETRPRRCIPRHGLLDNPRFASRASSGLSFDLDQRIDARFGHEEMLPIHLQHHKPFLVEADQASPLGLRLSPSIGVHQEVCPAQHDSPSPTLAHRVCHRPPQGAACVAMIRDRRMRHSRCDGRTLMGASTGLAVCGTWSSVNPHPSYTGDRR
jgi:hypothetical protein